jgi:hypothetical protein
VPVAIGRVFMGAAVQSNRVALEVGFDHFRLLVRRPPQTRSAAEAAATEIWTMCDEFWISDGPEALIYRRDRQLYPGVRQSGHCGSTRLPACNFAFARISSACL